eukprot:223027-Pyramimonas_sp.AAC.1
MMRRGMTRTTRAICTPPPTRRCSRTSGTCGRGRSATSTRRGLSYGQGSRCGHTASKNWRWN